ncbi:MAG: ABC transporter substrate-binding protein [Gaiella sp.]
MTGLLGAFVPSSLGDAAAGIVYGQPTPPDPAASWVEYRSAFESAYPALPFVATSILAVDYYIAMQAVLRTLDRVGGHFSNGQQFRMAMARLTLESPIGTIRLDRNRQAIADNYVFRLDLPGPSPNLLRTIRAVEQTFNGYFRSESAPPGQQSPACVRREPPPWTFGWCQGDSRYRPDLEQHLVPGGQWIRLAARQPASRIDAVRSGCHDRSRDVMWPAAGTASCVRGGA